MGIRSCFLRRTACFWVLAVWTCFWFSNRSAFGQTERILSFDSRITVHENNSLTVRETIQVEAAGYKIQRGIYRTFPTRYKDKNGNRYVVGFNVLEVLRDGQSEPYHLKNVSNGVAVYIGDKNVLLQPGVYTYTLTYQTDHQLGFFKDYDELYWNVTGDDWDFQIVNASAEIELPESIRYRILHTNGWTGFKGSTEQAFRMKDIQWPLLRFETTRILEPREGFTIVASWPKGLIPEPTRTEKIRRTLRNNIGLGIAFLGALLLLVYYLWIWFRVGRDPEKGPVIPLFEAPENLSPAAVRYMREMGYDHKVFAAALLNMAVKGFLKIKQEKNSYILTRENGDESALSPEERKIARILLPSKGSIELKQSNHAVIQQAVQELKNSLKLKYNKAYFVKNRGYFVPGLLLSIAGLIIAILSFRSAEAGFLIIWLSIWSAGVVVLLFVVARAWKSAFQGGVHGGNMVGALFITFFSIPFIAGEVFGLYGLLTNTSPFMLAAIIMVVGMNALFYQLLKAPTVIGRKLLDKIEGFKMFLGTAEKDRLNFAVPLKKTPEVFEKFLPYALALNVEQAWAENFTDVLTRAGQSGSESAYHPVWYSGRSLDSFQPSSFASSFGGGMVSSISSSSTAPGSSSGSGGGGSSGGGGGGGGGGGW